MGKYCEISKSITEKKNNREKAAAKGRKEFVGEVRGESITLIFQDSTCKPRKALTRRRQINSLSSFLFSLSNRRRTPKGKTVFLFFKKTKKKNSLWGKFYSPVVLFVVGFGLCLNTLSPPPSIYTLSTSFSRPYFSHYTATLFVFYSKS